MLDLETNVKRASSRSGVHPPAAARGTRLFIDVLPLKLRGVNGFLLPPGEFKATLHMQCQFAVLPVRDDLPHYKSRPARFGGSDETVDW